MSRLTPALLLATLLVLPAGLASAQAVAPPTLTVTGINSACNGRSIRVTLKSGSTSLIEVTGTVASGALASVVAMNGEPM